MTLHVASGGNVLDPGAGEPRWCAGSLLPSKATRAQTTGPLAVAMIDGRELYFPVTAGVMQRVAGHRGGV